MHQRQVSEQLVSSWGCLGEILKPLTVGTLLQKVGVALRFYNLAQLPALWLSVPRVPWKV